MVGDRATEGSADLDVTTPGADLAWSAADRRAVNLIRGLLAQEPVAARVVSMPYVEWFTAQEPSYQEEVLPARVRARVSVEAGVALGWRGFAGDAGECVRLDHFGASADYQVLFEKFGLTAERVAEAARTSLARVPRVAQPGAGGQN